ncbi:TetR/AcrR family transcriptional regulator [Pseudooceanicola onchidii]|uniref:TetR/AcrR family transcriptional regulator n=1 Tax=Pseudooceanicola onchidii TaxID=2562279 RepID=UPI0010AAD6EA|nr:TetR/AcrR family transcriptional regulator [Pseudooceanicola onchidii]
MTKPAQKLSSARQPQRTRGKERVRHLLDVTEDLLAEHTDTEVTLAMIAERAEVPLPSVYHFFPNRNAIYVELARRFHQELAELSGSHIAPPPDRWQTLLLTRQSRGRDYLNGRPAALRLFMGAGVSAEVRTLDLRGNSSLARVRAEEFRRRFICTGLDRLEDWLAVSIGVMDGVWMISYAEHGRITDHYLQEAWRASVAYLRIYLPEELLPHPEFSS